MFAPLTSLYAAILCILFIVLSFNVIKLRRKYKLSISNGKRLDLQRAVRAHGNFSEYTPLFLVMLFLAEVNGFILLGIHILGIVFCFGRAMHAYSLVKDEKYEGAKMVRGGGLRKAGMMMTFLCLGCLACISIIQFIISMS